MNEHNMKQAVILAGGAGTRLASRLNGLPKPLVDVDGTPLLGRQLQQLAAHGFGEVVILVNYRAEAIQEFCAAYAPEGLKVRVINDGESPRGTAGATYDARWALAERFVVIYGDTLFDVDLTRLWHAHAAAREQGASATLFLHPNDHPHDSDLVAVGPDGYVTAFYPNPHPPGVWQRNLVNAALYVIEKDMLGTVAMPEGDVDFGRYLFPAAIRSGCRLKGYSSFEYIKDVGTPERLDRATLDLRNGRVSRAKLASPQKAVFIDRDGTLNKPAGHIATPGRLELIEGVGEAVRALNRAEYRCVMVTNQPVVARGECTEDMLDTIHAKLETLLGQSGAFLDASYVCPHHTDSGFPGERLELKFHCDCRKPRPGMINQAVADLHLDRTSSWMIGDSEADIGAARAASITSILLRSSGDETPMMQYEPDFEAPSMPEAVAFILHGYPTLRSMLHHAIDAVEPGQIVNIAGLDASHIRAVATTVRHMLQERGLACEHISLRGSPHFPSHVRQPDHAPKETTAAAAAKENAAQAVVVAEISASRPDAFHERASLTVLVLPHARDGASGEGAGRSWAASPQPADHRARAFPGGNGSAHMTITMPMKRIRK